MADLTLHDMDWQDFRDWDNSRIMETYISSPEIDKQNDLIPTEAIKSAMDFYMKYGIYSYKHDEIPIGRPLSYCVKDGKVKLKVGIYDKLPMHNKVWKEIQEHGEKGTSSIRGEALDKKVVCDEGTCHNLINELGLWSVSWVGDNPANKDAVVSFVSMAKYDDGEDQLIKQLKDVHNMLVEKYNGMSRGKVGISGKFTLDDEVAAIREEAAEQQERDVKQFEDQARRDEEERQAEEDEPIEDEQMEEAAEEGLVPEEAGVQEATPAEEAETVTQEAEELTYSSMGAEGPTVSPTEGLEYIDDANMEEYNQRLLEDFENAYKEWEQRLAELEKEYEVGKIGEFDEDSAVRIGFENAIEEIRNNPPTMEGYVTEHTDLKAKELLDTAYKSYQAGLAAGKEADFSKQELARQLGVSVDQVERYVLGTLGYRSFNTQQEYEQFLQSGDIPLPEGSFYDYNVGVMIGSDEKLYDWEGNEFQINDIWPNYYEGLSYAFDGTGLWFDDDMGLYFDAVSDTYYDYYGEPYPGQEIRDYYSGNYNQYTGDTSQMRINTARDVYGQPYEAPMPTQGGGGSDEEEEPEEEEKAKGTIEERDGLFCVINAEGKELKCYKTKKGAEARLSKLTGE